MYCARLRPTGIIAGKTVRAVLESAGVRGVEQLLGSKNPADSVKATAGLNKCAAART